MWPLHRVLLAWFIEIRRCTGFWTLQHIMNLHHCLTITVNSRRTLKKRDLAFYLCVDALAPRPLLSEDDGRHRSVLKANWKWTELPVLFISLPSSNLYHDHKTLSFTCTTNGHNESIVSIFTDSNSHRDIVTYCRMSVGTSASSSYICCFYGGISDSHPKKQNSGFGALVVKSKDFVGVMLLDIMLGQ